jgi:hypothetical protein
VEHPYDGARSCSMTGGAENVSDAIAYHIFHQVRVRVQDVLGIKIRDPWRCRWEIEWVALDI